MTNQYTPLQLQRLLFKGLNAVFTIQYCKQLSKKVRGKSDKAILRHILLDVAREEVLDDNAIVSFVETCYGEWKAGGKIAYLPETFELFCMDLDVEALEA